MIMGKRTITGTKKPQLSGFNANSLQVGCSAVNVGLPNTRIYINISIYIRATVVLVRLFRAVKKNCISGEPASPIADNIPRCERIKTDYNSYLYTWCRLIAYKSITCIKSRCFCAGYGFVFKKLKDGYQK